MKKQKEVIQVKEHQREIKKKEEKMTKKDFKKYYKGRCQALTTTGKQCTRDAVGSKYCWQHQVEEN